MVAAVRAMQQALGRPVSSSIDDQMIGARVVELQQYLSTQVDASTPSGFRFDPLKVQSNLMDVSLQSAIVELQLAIVDTGTTLPGLLGWPSETYPIDFGYNGSAYTSNFNPESYAAAALAGPTYYVDVSRGNNANTGLDPNLPLQSIWRATALGNTAAVPFNVRVAAVAAGYPREHGFTNNGSVTPNTVAAAYIATGGTAEVWVGSLLAWPGAPDATFPNTYKVARSVVSRVLDLTTNDADGDYVELTKVATAALCNSTPNSWAQVAGDLYVNKNGAQVTSQNTRVLLQTIANFYLNGTSKDVYLKGFDFQGGTAGAVAMVAAATMNFIAVDCKAGYTGDSAVNVNAWKIDYVTGLVALVRCVGRRAVADQINGHWSPGGVPGLFLLTIDCKGRNTATVGGVQSCNGLTTHDDIISIDLNGEYYGNAGANVIPIQACKMYCLGTYAHDSLGDIAAGGATTPTDFQTQFTAQLWLQETRSNGSAIALLASNTSTIRKRNHRQGSGQVEGAGGGTITTF